MKVCLYLENPTYYKGCGIEKSFQHQEKELKSAKIEYTKNPKEDYDLLLVNSTWLKSYFEVRRARKNGKKVIIYAHMTAEDFRNSMILSNFIAPILKKWIEFLYSKADLIISPSNYTRDLLKERYPLLKEKEIVTLSNGVDITEWRHSDKKARSFRKELGLNKPIVLGIGMVFIRKGILDFIRIARKIKEANFVWIGRYNKKIANNSILNKEIATKPDNFKLVGYIPDIKGAYSGSDIFFFPSHEENEGIVVLEAAAMKKPIVVRDLPVFKSYLRNNLNCMMGRSNLELEQTLRDLLKDKKKRVMLGKNARKLAEKKDLKVNGARLKEILKKVLLDK